MKVWNSESVIARTAFFVFDIFTTKVFRDIKIETLLKSGHIPPPSFHMRGIKIFQTHVNNPRYPIRSSLHALPTSYTTAIISSYIHNP